MFAPGTRVEVVSDRYESGWQGVVIDEKPTNGDDCYVNIDHTFKAIDTPFRLSYPFTSLKGIAPAPQPEKDKPQRVCYVTRPREQWTDRGHYNTRKSGKVTAVRVAKGDPSGRGGQFHGATNFKEITL